MIWGQGSNRAPHTVPGPRLKARGIEHLPPVSGPFRRFLPRRRQMGVSPSACVGTIIIRKILTHGCKAVFTQLVFVETRRAPQTILVYCQGAQRSIGGNESVKTARGSAPLALCRGLLLPFRIAPDRRSDMQLAGRCGREAAFIHIHQVSTSLAFENNRRAELFSGSALFI